MKKRLQSTVLLASLLALVGAGGGYAGSQEPSANCRGLPDRAELRALLRAAANPANGGVVGGLFQGTRMWGAVVNRDGEICSYVTSTDDPTQVWPGSQAIAKAKGYTANA